MAGLTVLTTSPRVAPEQRHQLVVDGNAGDEVIASDDWGFFKGTVTHDIGGVTHTYNVYNKGLYAQLLIDQLITQPPAI